MRKAKASLSLKLNLKALFALFAFKNAGNDFIGGRMKCKSVNNYMKEKQKKVFLTDDPDILIVSYKDDATAFNGLKKGTITGKGAINNRMTNLLFQKLEKEGIPTTLFRS